jgi:hypothetical protein
MTTALIITIETRDNLGSYAVDYSLGGQFFGSIDTGTTDRLRAIDIATERIGAWLRDELDLEVFVPESEPGRPEA